MSLYDFRISVLSELLPKQPKPRLLQFKESHFPTKYISGNNGKTLQCQLCHLNKKTRKDTSYYCTHFPGQPSLCIKP